jgi:hypothetical protein
MKKVLIVVSIVGLLLIAGAVKQAAESVGGARVVGSARVGPGEVVELTMNPSVKCRLPGPRRPISVLK